MNDRLIHLISEDLQVKAIVTAFGPGRSYTLTELSNGVKMEKPVVETKLKELILEDIVEKHLHNKRVYYKLTQAAYRVLEEPLDLESRDDIRSFKKTDTARRERQARTCYSHLAGKLGVFMTDRLLDKQLIKLDGNTFLLTDQGMAYLKKMGIDEISLRQAQVSKACLDWSERKYHLGSPLGRVLTRFYLNESWVKTVHGTRAIQVTPLGKEKMRNI